MKYFKLIFAMMGILMNTMAQQWYEMRTMYPLYISNCDEQQADSLLLCAALGRGTKDVTFFFNADNHQCRWNCTYIYTVLICQMKKNIWRKYEMEWTKNGAFQIMADASSVYANHYGYWSPRYATDGFIQSGDVSLFHSASETSPWIRVDLQDVTTIFFLRVFLRADARADRFHDVAVEVTNRSIYQQRGFYEGPAITSGVVEILCEYPTIGRYVRLRIIKGTDNFLNIPELEIYIT